MKQPPRFPIAVGAAVLTAFPGLVLAPAASADPAPADSAAADSAPPAPQPEQVMSQSAPMAPDTVDAVSAACRQFGAALDLASSYYEEFAYATAGSGNSVNYQDPSISQYNVLGRTALREAAGSALDAAGTPGLPADVADPMRSWSLHATKLIVIMGLRGGGDSLNSAATDLNTDANNVQMACALNGGRP